MGRSIIDAPLSLFIRWMPSGTNPDREPANLVVRSFLDAGVVLANVLAMGVGGVWALKIAGLYFNISAAVGFISILGVAVMNGLILISSFNQLRALGVPLNEALAQGVSKRIRPLTITALVAALGLLPAALSTEIGSDSQRPLAIVVVGGMLTTMLLVNFMPVLYRFYGHRTPPPAAATRGTDDIPDKRGEDKKWGQVHYRRFPLADRR